MRHSFLRQLIREALLLESPAPKWLENLIMSTDMDRQAIDVDPVTGRSCLDYFVEDNQQFIKTLESDHLAGTKPIKNIGFGFQGTVWQLPDGNVMKLANDYGWGEKTYNDYLSKMRDQHSGSPGSVADLRILDVFPIIWRSPKEEGEPYVPEHTQVAVIMDKVIPADKSESLEETLNTILVPIMLTLSNLCVPYLKIEYQDKARSFLTSGMNDVDLINHNAPMPGDLRPDENMTRYSNLMRDDIDERAVLAKISQEFLMTIDDELFPESRKAIENLPKIVGKEFHVRLHPNWWPRLKNALARATREGRSDIKAENFGIDSKGDIIPFDI